MRSIRAEEGFTLAGMMTLISVIGLAMALSTFPIVRWINERRSCMAAETVVSVLDRAGRMARAERNEFVVFFEAGGGTMWILDDDGGSDGAVRPGGRECVGNGKRDPGEKVFGPYELPPGRIFATSRECGPRTGTVSPASVSFTGDPPRVVFYPDGTASESGTICVVSESGRSNRSGSGRMMILESSTGSVLVRDLE